MAYVSTIPQANDQLSVSQPQILGNFGQINTWVNIDHTGLNAGNLGQHNKVTFPIQGSAPAFGGSNGLWSELYATTGAVGELWLNHRNGQQYPISASVLSQTPLVATNTSGWSYLSSGIVIKWGVTAGPFVLSNIDISSTGPAGGPNLAAAFSAQSTPLAANTTSWVGVLTNSNLRILNNIASDVYWFVIGRE